MYALNSGYHVVFHFWRVTNVIFELLPQPSSLLNWGISTPHFHDFQMCFSSHILDHSICPHWLLSSLDLVANNSDAVSQLCYELITLGPQHDGFLSHGLPLFSRENKLWNITLNSSLRVGQGNFIEPTSILIDRINMGHVDCQPMSNL